ncbi:MAG TPA: hypothetical protein PL151_04810 [Phycisphaerae bacterium]|nr:hypothetical protein [Phycisphaerae bacterium]HOJ75713.1 hypothetical protein [Phycisphaerae bacterium]HOM53146.1 hypothetical protein [Phycisphaerae bacterium]HOQ87324.1 hypothetical protein [Phycisphaerae bacterium]HPU27695.1 hypothetical protein [Phycisphaerae bacterium]
MALSLILLACPADVRAGTVIPFKLIAGRPCAYGTLHGPNKAIPANIVIDLGIRGSLLVHKNTAKLLQLDPDHPAELRFGDVVLSGLQVFSVDGRDLEELSKNHAEELGEVPAVAVLGLPALSHYILRMEIGEGRLELLAPGEAMPVEPVEGKAVTLPYEEERYGVWLKAFAGEDFQLRVRFMTSQLDTSIDAITADLAGSAGGAIDELLLGGINIARFVAFRPEDFSGMPEPRPDLVLGTNLLSSFRLTVNPTARQLTFEQIREPQFPAHERACFMAWASGEASAIEAYLDAHPDSRLGPESSQRLLKLRLEEEPVDPQAVVRAMRWRARTTAENRRAAGMVALADQLIAAGQWDLAEQALEIGAESVHADLNAVAGFQLSARRGLIAMNRNDLVQARKHLLSAAFGAPRDPTINLWLGQLYERTGRPLRAWSRYLQAALSQQAPPEAMQALDRLNRDPEFRATFTMADAEQLLEGRMVEFHPAERFLENDPDAQCPLRLVELFASADGGMTAAPELAFQGLFEYLESTPVVFIQYHLNSPMPDPLATRASLARSRYYQTTTAPAAFFDGQGPVTAEGSDRDAARVYAEYLEAAGLSGAANSKPGGASTRNSADAAQSLPAGAVGWTISGRATLHGDELKGTLVVEGPADRSSVRVHAVLCEKIVMLPGSNGLMLHKHVARALLSPEQGFALAPDTPARVDLAASFEAIAKDIEQDLADAEKSFDIRFNLRPTYVDRSALVVAAFVQDSNTRRVLAACALPVESPGSTSASTAKGTKQ